MKDALSLVTYDNEEYCPNCGKWVNGDEYDYGTGWCRNCSPYIYTKIESFLAKNADAIEFYIIQGYNFWQALDKLAKLTAPTCVVCGNKIRRASRSSIFCRQSATCRKFSRRYVYLYQTKGL